MEMMNDQTKAELKATMYDLIIIGGGPAGTSAAITAARNGSRVLLLERGRFPRHKVCGEFVSSEALGLLGKLLDLGCAAVLERAAHISRARIFLDSRVLQPPVQPAAASIARFDLDRALWTSAERCGVEAKQRVTVQKVAGLNPFLVTTSIGMFEARAVVNASGRWSNLNTPAPANGHARPKWVGLKAHFAEPSPPTTVDLYFFEGGYCGVQALSESSESVPGRINVCAMVRADIACSLREVVQLHPALRQRAALWQPLMHPISAAPLLFGRPRPAQDRVLTVGDAAGFVDPFVGDGISLALRSGVLAAQGLGPFFSSKVTLEEAVRAYAAEYERQLAPVFRASSKIRRMLFLPQALRHPIVSLLANAPAITKYLVRKTR